MEATLITFGVICCVGAIISMLRTAVKQGNERHAKDIADTRAEARQEIWEPKE